jgi:hypothetical protein
MPSLAIVVTYQTKISTAKFCCEAALAGITACKTDICHVLVQIPVNSAVSVNESTGFTPVINLSLNLGEFVSH